MANPDRLSALDASFLHIEDAGPHMHVGSVMVFSGHAPDYDAAVAHLERRMHLVPRYRQKLAFPPLVQGRPVWIDDPHFNPGYHLRHTALPRPAGITELRRLAGRVFAQRLDRSKPLWEMWLVDRLDLGDGEPRHAIVAKTHHALVDGVSGVDIATVMFDLEPDPPAPPDPPPAWFPRPEPTPAALLAESVVERAAAPLDAARGAAHVAADPRNTLNGVGRALSGVGSFVRAGFGAPASPLNVPIGPHRRFTWVTASLGGFKAIKSALGGTVNDVVLASVTGALRTWLLADGHEIADLTLRAMVPMSIRADAERGALGNRVSTMYAPLPVGIADPAERFAVVHEAMKGIKESGQAVGADVLTKLTGFAPPTVLGQAARLQSRQRAFNLTVTNVPGPQVPLYMLGNRLEAMYPQVPLVSNTALGIAIISYDGKLCFGLLADYDALPDVEDVAAALEAAIAELADLAGVDRIPALGGPGVKRLLPVLVGVLIVVGGLVGLLAYVSGRDTGGIATGDAPDQGVLEDDRGAAHQQGVGVGDRDGAPPSSGPHEPRNVTRERDADNAALLHAMELGDVVIAYPQAQPPPALTALQEEVTGPFDAELAAAGQMVILVRRAGIDGVEAVAWRRRLVPTGPDDPALRAFVEAWVGKGEGKTG